MISRRRVIPAAALLAVVAGLAPAPAVSAGPPDPRGETGPDPVRVDEVRSTEGVQVTGVERISERTIKVGYTTPSVSPEATFSGMSAYITFPRGYDARKKQRYSTLYLLHGGGDGDAADWHEQGRIEELTADSDLIVVMPDGGKVGWYTNWLDQRRYDQDWMHHHLDELVPFIDANLHTYGVQESRAIAGLSMGGFGAVHYAQWRPEMFASVTSMSGALDTNEPAIRATVTGQSTQHGMPTFGAFGVPLIGQDYQWIKVNPIHHAQALRGMQVNLYTGSGSDYNDISWDTIAGNTIEQIMARATRTFHQSLQAEGVEHHYLNYGAPKPACDGGHNWPCWRYAMTDALPRIDSVLKD